MKIITIEGLDGSGKGTQSKILKENLEKTGKKVALFSFPVYESYTGGKVKKYLTGELVWTSDSCEDFGGYEYPTHWMPLPNGPESNKE